MPRLWASVQQSLRTYQTEPIWRVEHPTGQGFHRTAPGCLNGSKRSPLNTLWSEARKHFAQIVSWSKHVFHADSHHNVIALQPSVPTDQGHRFWVGMSRTSDCLHLYSIEILSFPGGITRDGIYFGDRYVVPGLHCCWTLPWPSSIPRNQRV